MNKLDKQFEQMMKGIRIEAPSPDFTSKIMSRIQAEAAVQKRTAPLVYQPMIDRKTWILLIAAFLGLILYILFSGDNAAAASTTGFWSAFSDSIGQLKSTGIQNFWQKGVGVFSTIPMVAYLIVIASLALWNLDYLFERLRQETSKMKSLHHS